MTIPELNQENTLEALRQKTKDTEGQLRILQLKLDRSQQILQSLRTALLELPLPYLIVGQDHTVVYANEAARLMLGMRALEGKSYASVVYNRHEPPADCPVRKATETGKVHDGSIQLPGGLIKAWIIKPMEFSDGRRGSMILFMDGGNRPASIEDSRIEKLYALGEIVSGIAHELNNPLTGVLGFTELLAAGEHEPRTSDMIQKVLTEANRCRQIVANLLAFSRMDHSQRAPVEINDMILQALALKRYALDVANIEVECHLDPGIPKTIGDPCLLKQVFLNIINNAHHAMENKPGGGTLTIHTESDSYSIHIRFKDTGPGIPEELVPRIFDSFTTTKSSKDGTGLGLSISYKIIQNHDGRLTLGNSPAGGAEFVVELPILDTGENILGQTMPRESASMRMGSILIIDDEPSILELLSEVLTSRRHSVTTTTKAGEALELLSSTRFDCIFSDIKMPGMTGEEFYELVRAIEPDLAERIIFITGDCMSESTEAPISRPEIPCITKPFDVKIVIDRVDSMLEKHNVTGGDTPAGG
jgi:two-component system NtrC family sensor kinase